MLLSSFLEQNGVDPASVINSGGHNEEEDEDDDEEDEDEEEGYQASVASTAGEAQSPGKGLG